MTGYQLGQAVRAVCLWLAEMTGRLLRPRVLAALVVVVAGGAWIKGGGGVPRISLPAVFGGAVDLADCKFPLPSKGEYGPGCVCRTISQASYVYLPNKYGELIAPNRTDTTFVIGNGWVDVYGFSQKYPRYLFVQETHFWDMDTKRSVRSCPTNDAEPCTVGLIAANRILDNSCHYER